MPTDSSSSAPDTGTEMTRSLHRSAGSFELALAPVMLALIGLWLDRTLGTGALFAVLLAVLGVVGASVKAYYSYGHSMRQLQEQGPWAGHRSSAQFRADLDAARERDAA
jgi:F0F1-type ATP synthase assembly protein I